MTPDDAGRLGSSAVSPRPRPALTARCCAGAVVPQTAGTADARCARAAFRPPRWPWGGAAGAHFTRRCKLRLMSQPRGSRSFLFPPDAGTVSPRTPVDRRRVHPGRLSIAATTPAGRSLAAASPATSVVLRGNSVCLRCWVWVRPASGPFPPRSPPPTPGTTDEPFNAGRLSPRKPARTSSTCSNCCNYWDRLKASAPSEAHETGGDRRSSHVGLDGRHARAATVSMPRAEARRGRGGLDHIRRGAASCSWHLDSPPSSPCRSKPRPENFDATLPRTQRRFVLAAPWRRVRRAARSGAAPRTRL